MDYCNRYNELSRFFQAGINCHIDATNIDIQFFRFSSILPKKDESIFSDATITENHSFEYPVFLPSGKRQFDKSIMLLHGLNERNWNKYLPWAEFLCLQTGKPVILFPIAFHINRSPQEWANPHNMKSNIELRRKQCGYDRSISFANVAFSKRMSEDPKRFYLSGRQTLSDITQLADKIKRGNHPHFALNTQIDIFAYSIGAFLSQIALMVNPKKIFSHSRLCMFCGGSIFNAMAGASRLIMDKTAFEKLYNYYLYTFGKTKDEQWNRDRVFHSFYSMIAPERKKSERESFFKHLGKRIFGIVLKKDTVIPYDGVQAALGVRNAKKQIKLLDFAFPYTHENPFPVNTKDSASVNHSFLQVFSQIAAFLS